MRLMDDDLIIFDTSVKPIETTWNLQNEIDRQQKIGKCSLVGRKGHLGGTELLVFRQWLCQLFLGGSG